MARAGGRPRSHFESHAPDCPRLRLPLRGRVGIDDRADRRAADLGIVRARCRPAHPGQPDALGIGCGAVPGDSAHRRAPMFPMFTAGHRDVADGTRLPDRSMPKRKHSAPGLRKSGGLSRVAGAWSSAMSAASSTWTSEPTLTFTTEEIVGDEELPSTWHCIGPLLPPPPAPQLGRGRPLVYTSFGTNYNRRAELFQTVISGLTGEPVDVVISTGRGSVTPKTSHPYLRTSTCMTSAHPRGAGPGERPHHDGGCNSAHESLLAGVPMVCLPQAFDQLPLSRRIEQLGVGLVSEEDPVEVRRSCYRCSATRRLRRA